MSNKFRMASSDFDLEEIRQRQLIRAVLLTSLGGAALALVVFLTIELLNPEFPGEFLAPIVAVFIALSLLGVWLLNRGLSVLAASIHLGSVAVGLFIAMYFLNGSTGPMVMVLITIPVLAALFSGRTAAGWAALVISVFYVAAVVLEQLGLLVPRQVSGTAFQLVYSGAFILTLIITAYLVVYSTLLMQDALVTARQREQQLADASFKAEQSALAEREARVREAVTAKQVQQTVREYSVFLQRIADGDYSARLSLNAEESESELAMLGQQLNETVETLIAALRDQQTIQQRYVREAWQSFLETSAVPPGFRYQGEGVDPAAKAWLDSMTDAVKNRGSAANERELAVPITLRGEVIGALGIRREEMAEWSEEDRALVEMITDQLAQTIDGLRLLDETQRSAARDRLLGEVTSRIRQTLDLDIILKTMANEMYRTLELDEVLIRLVTDETDGRSTD